MSTNAFCTYASEGFPLHLQACIILFEDAPVWRILDNLSLYSLIWDFLLSQIKIWTTTTWSNVWVFLPKPSWYELLIGFLMWTPASKYLHLTKFSNVCDFIHVLIFVIVSKCQKNPKLTNIVIFCEFCHALHSRTVIDSSPNLSTKS